MNVNSPDQNHARDRLMLDVTALNDAAHAAAKSARKAGHPLADRLRNLAALSDHIKDDL